MLKIYEHDVQLAEIIRETPETKTFRFGMVGKELPFRPGQFVMLTIDVPDYGPVTRPLSIASSPREKEIMDLTVKKMEGGVMSTFLCDRARVGDIYKIKGPYGVFTLDESAKSVVFIAAGSGIAPFRSMWRYAMEKKIYTDITLLFSSKTRDYIIFRDELAALHGNGMRVVHTITRNDDPNWTGYARRIDKEMLKHVIGSTDGKLFYACGPPGMCKSAVQALGELGADPKSIKTEEYD